MRAPNKNHQKITVERVKDKEFKPNVSFGIFKFTLKEKELSKILNQLNCEFVVEKEDNKTIYETHVDSARVLFFFHYNKRGLDYLSIHTNELIMDGIEIGSKKYNEVLHIVKNFCEKRAIMFSYTYCEDKAMDEIFIDFKNIGLSIWFSTFGDVSDISISRIESPPSPAKAKN